MLDFGDVLFVDREPASEPSHQIVAGRPAENVADRQAADAADSGDNQRWNDADDVLECEIPRDDK
jgi:hypothetical protein